MQSSSALESLAALSHPTRLAILVAADLVVPEKRGRQIIQRANIRALRDLMLFLAKDCCGGRADLCEPLIAELAECC